MILWMPEFLEKEGNRLLKLIEEPEPETVFILVAERQEKILNTILSRCQLVKLSQPSDEEITARLLRDQNLNENKLSTVISSSFQAGSSFLIMQPKKYKKLFFTSNKLSPTNLLTLNKKSGLGFGSHIRTQNPNLEGFIPRLLYSLNPPNMCFMV